MRVHNNSLAIVVGVLMTSCSSTPHVRVDQAGTEVSKCHSFAWLRTSSNPESLTEQHVRSTILQQLQKKGYSIATGEPDCKVTYSLATHEQPSSKPRVGVGVGGGSGGLGGGIGVSLPVGKRDRRAGEFAIDVIDAAKNAQIWHGAAESSFASEEISAQEATQIVADVLAKFPDAAP